MAEETTRLPVLIIPGFMSSGLQVSESSLRPDWKGARLWINLVSLGFQSVHFGGDSVRQQHTAKSQDAGNDDDDDGGEKQQQHVAYKSAWLTHMSLQSDLCSEIPGVKVRAIPSLEGVDYLTPGALTNHVSYVFGPVIQALTERGGYTAHVNVEAAPYDWRLAPKTMQERDAYFSNTAKTVEELYDRNNKTPVVLVCHSLGCKVGHYFLDYCRVHKGQGWVDKYIHTYMPVGGPHLGAPRATRSIISGTKMSLDAFLDDTEALNLGRSLGSGPWLVPAELPAGAPSNTFHQPHGLLRVKLPSPIVVESMLEKRKAISKSRHFKLSVVYGKTAVTTEYHEEENGKVTFPEEFLFRTHTESAYTAPQPHGDDTLQILLLEPGTESGKQEEQSWLSAILSLPYKILCCPCYLLSCTLRNLTALSTDATARAFGGTTVLAASRPIRVGATVSAQQPKGNIDLDLFYGEERKKDEASLRMCCEGQYMECCGVSLEWTAPKDIALAVSTPTIAARHESTKDLTFTQKGHEADSAALFCQERLQSTMTMMEDIYSKDPLLPREAVDAPPVQRVQAIYGTNLPTEVGGVYRHKHGMIDKGHLSNYYELDTSATLAQDATANGYRIQKGILEETKKTRQAIVGSGETKTASGDGTVPYYSLQHVRNWAKEGCEVQVTELDGAEHREILADKRFHDALLSYVVK